LVEIFGNGFTFFKKIHLFPLFFFFFFVKRKQIQTGDNSSATNIGFTKYERTLPQQTKSFHLVGTTSTHDEFGGRPATISGRSMGMYLLWYSAAMSKSDVDWTAL
jgi:hypothetical protein